MKIFTMKDERMESNIHESRRSPTAREIRKRIYGIVITRGSVIGRDVSDWLRARQNLKHEQPAANGSKHYNPRGDGAQTPNRAVRTGE
jgi:hypothetical protein